jgi:transcriptional regulator with XRE-family HTH domain
MPVRERRIDRADTRARRALEELGRELRGARVGLGLSQREVGKAAGVAASTVSRIERAVFVEAPLRLLVRLHGVVGLDLAVRTFPGTMPLRDASHAELLGRLRAILPATVRWRTEVPVGPGDQRAWDVALGSGTALVGVEAETRVADAQALDRRVQLKLADSDLKVAILLLNDTLRNRRVVREFPDAFANYPERGREILPLLRAGRLPTRSGIVFL